MPLVNAWAGDGVPSLDRIRLRGQRTLLGELGSRTATTTTAIPPRRSWSPGSPTIISRPILARFISAVMCRGADSSKGFIGAGGINGGQLLDEDFPPLTVPYSATTSDTNGTLSYGIIDVGYSLIRQPNFRLGPFVGYGRWNEFITASGCTQIGGNPDICQPAVPTSFALVNETDHWNLLRLGATADVMLGDHSSSRRMRPMCAPSRTR